LGQTHRAISLLDQAKSLREIIIKQSDDEAILPEALLFLTTQDSLMSPVGAHTVHPNISVMLPSSYNELPNSSGSVEDKINAAIEDMFKDNQSYACTPQNTNHHQEKESHHPSPSPPPYTSCNQGCKSATNWVSLGSDFDCQVLDHLNLYTEGDECLKIKKMAGKEHAQPRIVLAKTSNNKKSYYEGIFICPEYGKGDDSCRASEFIHIYFSLSFMCISHCLEQKHK
jgi:hypothetical protein